MAVVIRSGEVLARLVDRRRFLKQVSMTLFGIASASALALGRPSEAWAITCRHYSSSCGCSPLNGHWCTSCNSGADPSCASTCSPYGNWNGSSCWCTQDCCYSGGRYSGYYECCDCTCGGTNCTCSHFVYTCIAASASSALPANPQFIPCC